MALKLYGSARHERRPVRRAQRLERELELKALRSQPSLRRSHTSRRAGCEVARRLAPDDDERFRATRRTSGREARGLLDVVSRTTMKPGAGETEGASASTRRSPGMVVCA